MTLLSWVMWHRQLMQPRTQWSVHRNENQLDYNYRPMSLAADALDPPLLFVSLRVYVCVWVCGKNKKIQDKH